jgi:hypothetical protein
MCLRALKALLILSNNPFKGLIMLKQEFLHLRRVKGFDKIFITVPATLQSTLLQVFFAFAKQVYMFLLQLQGKVFP